MTEENEPEPGWMAPLRLAVIEAIWQADPGTFNDKTVLAIADGVQPAIGKAHSFGLLAGAIRVSRDLALKDQRVTELEDAAYGDATVRLLGPVDQIKHLHASLAAQMSRADTLDRLCREHRARVDEVERRHIFDTAELKKRIAELEKDSATLAALEAHGVDNWEGYDDALSGEDPR